MRSTSTTQQLITLTTLFLLLALCATAAEPAISIAGEWADHLGPTRAFADPGEVELIDKISEARVAWTSEESGIGFGKANSGAMKGGFAKGSGLPPSGAATPILAGGMVIQSYFLPCGPVFDKAARERLSARGTGFTSFTQVAADDVVIAIDAATGKTRWKTVFKDKGITYAPGKRGEWNVTPCADKGRVFAFGTMGRVYALELKTGKVLWETDIGPVHKRIVDMKAKALEQGRMVRPGVRPYGMLLVLDDVLVAPDWRNGLIGLAPATGKELWRASERDGITSGCNMPMPVTVKGKSYLACANRTGVLRLVDHRTGKVLWSHPLGSLHYTQPVFGKELLLVMDPNQHHVGKKDTETLKTYGVLAAYRLSMTGATRAWKLDDEKYPVELRMDGGPGRRVYTRRDGILYHAAWKGYESKLAIVSESDGKILASLDDAKHFWCVYLWGNRFFFLTDIQHGKHSTWQVYDRKTTEPTLLDQGTFPGYGTHRTCGYEVPLYDIFADGFMFCREFNINDQWGGIVCYDLRK